jgi:hypothetical protein
MIYTGIGSRATPANVLVIMTDLARMLGADDWILRSGGAEGADEAFEDGVESCMDMEIYLPFKSFNNRCSVNVGYYCPEVSLANKYIAANIHPAWDRCSSAARAMMYRNTHQILGGDLTVLTDMVICWTPEGAVTGGTGQALRLAEYYEVPVLNLGLAKIKQYTADELYAFIQRKFRA